MNEPVTVIIPAYNAATTLRHAVKSALGAGANEVLLFDDASTDETQDACLDLQFAYMGSFYFMDCGFHAGIVFARNFLIKQAKPGLIIPLDADDTLRDITPLLAAYEPGTWVYGNYAEHDGQIVNTIQAPPPGTLARKNVCNATMLFHKQDWERAGGYDVDFAYAEDWAFQCALVNAGVQAKQVDAVVFDRYIHPNGNERTAKATAYWSFYRDMARSKYPAVFAGTG